MKVMQQAKYFAARVAVSCATVTNSHNVAIDTLTNSVAWRGGGGGGLDCAKFGMAKSGAGKIRPEF